MKITSKILLIFMLSLNFVTVTLVVNYYYKDAYSYINYYDNDLTYTAYSEGSVRYGGPISACVGNGADFWYCDLDFKTGTTSTISHTFPIRNSYLSHNHAIYDHSSLSYLNIK